MKYHIIIGLVLTLLNCSSDDIKTHTENENLIGKWKLIEQLADPDDGSRTFDPVESNRTIEFFSNGVVVVNGSLCYMSVEVDKKNSGIFEVMSDDAADTTNDGFLTPSNCEFSEVKIYFDLPLSGHLILWYPCIEPCGQKFVKI